MIAAVSRSPTIFTFLLVFSDMSGAVKQRYTKLAAEGALTTRIAFRRSG